VSQAPLKRKELAALQQKANGIEQWARGQRCPA
jgi:hypothetical protein